MNETDVETVVVWRCRQGKYVMAMPTNLFGRCWCRLPGCCEPFNRLSDARLCLPEALATYTIMAEAPRGGRGEKVQLGNVDLTVPTASNRRSLGCFKSPVTAPGFSCSSTLDASKTGGYDISIT